MNDDKLPAASTSAAGNVARHIAPTVETGQAGRRAATRTVGVYDRPARRARLSLPLVIILILSALVSVVAAARFLF